MSLLRRCPSVRRLTAICHVAFLASMALLAGCTDPIVSPQGTADEVPMHALSAGLVPVGSGARVRTDAQNNSGWLLQLPETDPLARARLHLRGALQFNLLTGPRLIGTVIEFPAILNEGNPFRSTMVCGFQTVTSQISVAAPPVDRSSECGFSNGTAGISARAGSTGGSEVILGSKARIFANGTVLDPGVGRVSRHVHAIYYDTVRIAANAPAATVSLTFRIDGKLQNLFTPNSPNLIQADNAGAAITLVVPRPDCQTFAPECRTGQLIIDWLALTKMPGTRFNGTFLPTPPFVFGYLTETKIFGHVTFDVPVTDAGAVPIMVQLAAFASVANISPTSQIAAYGDVYADFLNTTFLEHVTVMDAEGRDITAQAAPALASGIVMPGIVKFPQIVAFVPTPPMSAILGSTILLAAVGGESGNPVTITSQTPETCQFSAGVVSLLAVGPCVMAADQQGNSTFAGAPQAMATIAVTWPFGGFESPIGDALTVNRANAGRVVPVKFGLGGDRGLEVLANGSPASAPVPCTGSGDVGTSLPTVSPTGRGISYDPVTQVYAYLWVTDDSWKRTCRQLRVRLRDGTTHVALFQFI